MCLASLALTQWIVFKVMHNKCFANLFFWFGACYFILMTFYVSIPQLVSRNSVIGHLPRHHKLYQQYSNNQTKVIELFTL